MSKNISKERKNEKHLQITRNLLTMITFFFSHQNKSKQNTFFSINQSLKDTATCDTGHTKKTLSHTNKSMW